MAKIDKKKAVKSTKAIDKWKLKKTFEVIAPEIFNKVPVGPVVVNEGKDLIGRIIETTLSKLVNSNQHHIRIKLIVESISGFQAFTKVKSVDVSRTYMGSHVSEGIDIIDLIFPATTKDKRRFKIKIALFTRRKVHDNQKKQLRKLASTIVKDGSSKNSGDEFIQEVVFGKVGSQIFNRGKKIVPLSRVEVRKLELIG
ncbi:MAG: hypothetical protein JXB14_02080 [Candidatus Altiarchaeota archaeon]|nr:hypothetical protein [Candidatus Altiarchaeota archaeon]